MAKRRRLTPPVFGPETAPEEGSVLSSGELPPDLETKAMFPMGVARTVTSPSPALSSGPVSRPPIAQVAGEAAAMAALEGIGAEVARARAEGRIVDRIALDHIAADHLVRDRVVLDEAETEALETSLRARGQQVPIEVLDRGPEAVPRYGLISGWRRLAALRRIGAGTALAIVRAPATAAEAYVAMVEENEIRADISFYERARIVTRALEEGVYPDAKAALQGLFGNVSRAKRSKIKSFMVIVTELGAALRFPAAISEKAGLDLVARLEADRGLGARLSQKLAQAEPATAEAERALLATGTATPVRGTPPVKPVFDVVLDPATQQIRIAGAGVDEALLRDLTRWLARR